MARVTVEDCLEQIPNRFALALLASMRARTLLTNAECTLETDNKPCVSALREIAVGNVHYNMDVNDVLSGKVCVAKKSKKSRKY